MKRCPYCAEEIQEDAKKCKHCGEWLDNSHQTAGDTFKNVVGKSLSFVKDQKEKYQERKTAHLYIPTDEKPLDINGTVFYSKYFVFNNNPYNYADIVSIKYFAQVNTTNFITTDAKNELILYFNIEDNFPLEKRISNNVVDLTASSFFGIGNGRKTREQIELICQFLKKITFQIRANLYLEQLQNHGFFYIPCNHSYSYKIYNNGDIQKEDKIRVNIYEAFKNETIEYGSYLRSLTGRSSYSNPYLFTVYHSQNMGLFSKKTEIEMLYDKDIFDALFAQLIKTGTFLPQT